MRKRGKIKVIHPGGNSAVMAYDLASRLLSREILARFTSFKRLSNSYL